MFLKKAQKLKREANEVENTRRGKHSEQNSKEARNHGTFPCNILAGGPVGSLMAKLKCGSRFGTDLRT